MVHFIGNRASEALAPTWPGLGPAKPTTSAERQRALRLVANLPDLRIVFAHQVHGDGVIRVQADTPSGLPADAQVTSSREVMLGVYTADCVPLLLAGKTTVATVHAGWRGLCAGVIERALDMLCTEDGCAPAQVAAVIGPAIERRCYGVRAEARERLAAAANLYDVAQAVQPQGAGEEANEGEATVDLAMLSRAALQRAGVNQALIEVIDICTYCSMDHHSYRRDGVSAGRQFCLIGFRAAAFFVG